MGILDWFRNRPDQFDPHRVSAEMVRGAVEKAMALTNPRLKLVPSCHKRLTPTVATTIEFLNSCARSFKRCQLRDRCRRPSGLPIRSCGHFSSRRRTFRLSSGARTTCALCSTSSPNLTRPTSFSAWRSRSRGSSVWRCTGKRCSAMWPRPVSAFRITGRVSAGVMMRACGVSRASRHSNISLPRPCRRSEPSVSKGRSYRQVAH